MSRTGVKSSALGPLAFFSNHHPEYERPVSIVSGPAGIYVSILGRQIVASIGYVYGRRVYLDIMIKQLQASESPVSYGGEFFKLDRVKLIPPLPIDLFSDRVKDVLCRPSPFRSGP